MTLVEFLLARIADDEAVTRRRIEDNAEGRASWEGLDPLDGCTPEQRAAILAEIAEDDARGPHFARVVTAERYLIECEAKRGIIEWHKSWPVLVETPPVFEPALDADFVSSASFRMSQQIAWLTEQEYRNRFGSEPPTGPVLRLLALPYADHPDYREEWRP